MLVLTTKDDVFSPAFIWKEDSDHKDKGQWQLSQEISLEAEFGYKLLLTQVKKPGPRGGVRTTSSEPLFPGANMADTRRAVANTAIETVNTVTDGYRKRELAEHADRYPQLNSGVSENPMEIDKLKYDDEAYGEFAGTIAGAIGMVGTRRPPKSLLKRNKILDDTNNYEFSSSDLAKLQANRYSHTLERHGPEISDEQLKRRVLEGVAPDGSTIPKVVRGEQVGNVIPPLSSKFSTNKDLKIALDATDKKSDAFQKALADAQNDLLPGKSLNRFKFQADLDKNVGYGYKAPADSPKYVTSGNRLAGEPIKVDNLTKVEARYQMNTTTGEFELNSLFPIE